MNTNLFQTILTVLITISGIATSLLVSMGCTQSVNGSLNCATTSAPAWLVPYLVIAASVLGIVKLIIAAFDGKLSAPTVAVSKTGTTGTVTADQIAK